MFPYHPCPTTPDEAELFWLPAAILLPLVWHQTHFVATAARFVTSQIPAGRLLAERLQGIMANDGPLLLWPFLRNSVHCRPQEQTEDKRSPGQARGSNFSLSPESTMASKTSYEMFQSLRDFRCVPGSRINSNSLQFTTTVRSASNFHTSNVVKPCPLRAPVLFTGV